MGLALWSVAFALGALPWGRALLSKATPADAQEALSVSIRPSLQQVFGEDSSQDDVYAETQPLIRSVLDGAGGREVDVGRPCCGAACEQPGSACRDMCLSTCLPHVVPSAGYNVCIFAYGQTGSGEGPLHQQHRMQLSLIALSGACGCQPPACMPH